MLSHTAHKSDMMDQKAMSKSVFFDYLENAVNPKRFDSMLILLGAAALIFVIYILKGRRKGKLPSGPTGLPIFGYYFSLRKKPVETLTLLAKKYGNVVGFYIGPKYVVFLNDWEAVKEGLGQNTTLDRPLSLFQKIPYKFGFGGSNGAEWVETRRLASKVTKDGLKRNQWEDLIEKELSDLVESITEKSGEPIKVRSFFRDSFSNNVLSLLLGRRLEAGHPSTKLVSRSVDLFTDNLQIIQMINFSESFAKFLSILGVEKLSPFIKEVMSFINFVSDTVDSSKSHSEVSDSFISRFQEEIKNRKKMKQNTYATEDGLKGSVVALTVGGSETTRTSIIWALIAMADHQDLQKKVHEELDRVIGKEGSIRWSEKSNIPYTLASLLESMRWRTTVPFPAMRIVTEDIQIQGYHIPKGTYLGTHTWYLHNDPRYWKDPDQFIPERFLMEDGQKVNISPESFNPFSYGKRNCPGKLLALMDMLQFFSTLMLKFQVVPKEGDKVKYEGVLGLSYQAHNVELRFLRR